MLKAICTKAFQFKGSMMRSGAVIDVTDAESKDPWVTSHCNIERPDEKKSEKPKTKTTETPAKTAQEPGNALDEKELKAKLKKLGVVYEKTATRAELEALYEKARELVAGTPLEPNRPTELGI